MGTPIIKARDALSAIKTMRSGSLSRSAALTQKEKKLIRASSKIGARIIANPSASLTQSQFRKVLKEVRAGSARTEASQRPFAPWKSTSQIARRTLKALSEDQKEAKTAQGEEKSEWEQKRAGKQEEAKRHVLALEAKGKEEAALQREIAKRGQTVASEQAKEAIRKEQEELADKDPKQLAKYAIDIPD